MFVSIRELFSFEHSRWTTLMFVVLINNHHYAEVILYKLRNRFCNEKTVTRIMVNVICISTSYMVIHIEKDNNYNICDVVFSCYLKCNNWCLSYLLNCYMS